MKYRLFGKKTGLYASELILGTAMFGTGKGYGADAEESIHILNSYADLGGNFIDTSDAYQYGDSEKIVGSFIAGRRDDFIISTKFSRSSIANPSVSMLGNNRKAILQSVDHSLKRLKTDYIDIYLAHFDDGVTPPEELSSILDDLVKAGKILYGGLSNFPAWKIVTAINSASLTRQTPIIALQTEFSLIMRTPDKELLPMAAHFGLGVMAYSPLSGGLLTGKYRTSDSGRISLMNKEALINDPRNEKIVDKVLAISSETGFSPGNIAIAWLNARSLFAVIGPRTILHLEDYLNSVNLKLSEDQIGGLNTVSDIPLGYPHEGNEAQRKQMMLNKL